MWRPVTRKYVSTCAKVNAVQSLDGFNLDNYGLSDHEVGPMLR